MSDFFCDKGERVKAKRIYDYLVRNSNATTSQINTFIELLADNLGLENDGMDEISLEEFDEEFSNYFKQKSILECWNTLKNILHAHNCQIWGIK